MSTTTDSHETFASTEIENDDSMFKQGNYKSKSLDEKEDKNGFIKKVYGILTA